MSVRTFPVIDPVATGKNILRLRIERDLSVGDLQRWFNFDAPRAIYKWQSGETLPSVDNLYALSVLLDVPMNDILVAAGSRASYAASQAFARETAVVFWKKRSPDPNGSGLLKLLTNPMPPLCKGCNLGRYPWLSPWESSDR